MTGGPPASPRLVQVRAETAGTDYRDYLPAVYRREDRDGFLRRFLALFRAEADDRGRARADMHHRFDPATVPADDLVWLAGWLGFDPPPRLTPADLRSLRPRVHELYRRRGTLAGLREFVHLSTGVRPRILEAFRERRLWLLGHTSALGFDTALPPADADGMTVPDSAAPPRRRPGGRRFNRARTARVVEALKGYPAFAEAVALGVGGDEGARRAHLARRRQRDDDWFFDCFGINY